MRTSAARPCSRSFQLAAAAVSAGARSPTPGSSAAALPAGRAGRLLPRHALRLVAASITSLKWNGHEYFGQWFERYDPTDPRRDHRSGRGVPHRTTPASATPRPSRARASSGSASAPSASRTSRPTAASRPTTSSIPATWTVKREPDSDRVHPPAERHRAAMPTSTGRSCGSSTTRWCSSTGWRTPAARRSRRASTTTTSSRSTASRPGRTSWCDSRSSRARRGR